MNTLIKRITRIISAQVNAGADAVENPELMMRQTIREMEENLCRAKKEIVRTIAGKNMLEKEVLQTHSSVQTWQKNAETALKHDQEHLAREALIRKKELEAAEESMKHNLDKATQNCDLLKSHLKHLEHQLREAKRNFLSLLTRQRSALACRHLHDFSSPDHTTGTHTVNLTRFETKISEMEACAKAAFELEEEHNGIKTRIERLSIEKEVESELDKLKQTLSTEQQVI